jgi:hypothetical protein
MRPEDKPLTPYAIDHFRAMRNSALAAAEITRDRLSRPDLQPRGPLPVMDRLAEQELKAQFARMAIEALGGVCELSESEAFDEQVRAVSMPERRAA